MAESTPIQILDDDEFDWEAAVREIDFACENSKPSCSNNNNIINNNSNINVGNCSKQSTLDKFMAKSVPKPRPIGLSVNGSDGLGGGDGVSRVPIDPETANTWVYPVNVSKREYQYAITKKALFSNTMVALPTGLGKTLIAAVVMYNYFRWFPEGKIVFAAPSRPLVTQQIEACHNIVAIPQEWTIDMTGQTNPTKRACFWKTKRVFFVTPQVLERDIQSGTCLVDHLVCLVIDEAHRALGNYSYCVAVRELMAVPVQLRILALTATPGSKQQTIQTVIDNLHISTLEYRNENDHDVSPYVHNRKLELIEVAMGNDAVEINDLLLQIIGPFASKLSAIGVLSHRDYRTLSPMELINARDKLCEAPPPGLNKNKYEEANRCLTALITLYHIRKLLSSHGIRPAYEMLEEKLNDGRFARLMSTSGNIQKVKFLMQQSLSHGAPSPKLSKMLEILIDHFKSNDPQKSRVIIFSNFRGSVRDIMDAVAKVGELVKATEFIGQSTGKALKGQTQKVQQAVLEKFRAGKYNVIVATSIGEEGLDIMEVDMVICFDANISPLRMIQRMGRTGRKHDGRVVVLACEGSEIKGYMRKQANSKAVGKHMRNGGVNSFNFHLSPRMVPHVYKPEVQFVKFSIEQFIPNGKKERDDHTSRTPLFKEKLTVSQNNLIAKYFDRTRDGSWKPSLIAFPQFQAFPSKVHKVIHSSKTRMLIDTMQQLQELSFPSNGRNLFFEDEAAQDRDLGVDIIQEPLATKKDSLVVEKSRDAEVPMEVPDFEVSPLDTVKTMEKHTTSDTVCRNSTHSFFFGSEFVSIDDFGKVLILSVPLLPLKDVTEDKLASGSNALLQNCSTEDNCHLKFSSGKDEEEIIEANTFPDIREISQLKCLENNNFPVNGFLHFKSLQESTQDEVEKRFQTPRPYDKSMKEAQGNGETPQAVECGVPVFDQECSNDSGDVELSPRLTNFIRTGIVPESPIDDNDSVFVGVNEEEKEESAREITIPEKLCDDQLLISTSLENGKVIMDNYTCDKPHLVSPINSDIHTPMSKIKNSAPARACSASSIGEGIQTPLEHLSPHSCSIDWKLNSGDKSGSSHRTRKFKRLRRVGDFRRSRNLNEMKNASDISTGNMTRSCTTVGAQHKRRKGTRILNDNARAFIEEEAEVSSEAEVSDDEENNQENDSYDDSFIDDRTDLTQASTQAEGGKVDMMAIYRRSLLTQSPFGGHLNNLDCATPDNTVSLSRSLSGTLSGREPNSLTTIPTTSIHQITRRDADYSETIPDISSEVKPCNTCISPKEDLSLMGSRKRKSSYYQSGVVPAVNLEHQFSLCPDAAGNEMDPQNQGEINKTDEDMFSDDLFYEGLDLDEVEAQATLLLKQKLETATQKQGNISEFNLQKHSAPQSPTFDLGI